MQEVARTLNRVKTVGQARAAAGAALTYVGQNTYPALERADIPGELERSLRRQLDAARASLESAYKGLPAVSSWTLDGTTWAPARKAIERLYIESAGVEGAAGYKPRTTFAEALAAPLKEVTAAVGKGVAEAANLVGNAAGSAIGGAAGGLGLYGVLVVGAALLLFFRAKRGGLGI